MAQNLAMKEEARPAPRIEFARSGPQIFRRDAASSYAWWGNVAVVLGRQPPTAEHVVNYRACIVELHKQYPQGVGLITVVNDTSTPEPSGRDAMVKMFREIWPSITAALFVPNADGFKAAVMRSVMGAFILATGQRDRVRVERALAAGMPWLTQKLLGPQAAGERLQVLQAGVSQFCETEASWKGPQ